MERELERSGSFARLFPSLDAQDMEHVSAAKGDVAHTTWSSDGAEWSAGGSKQKQRDRQASSRDGQMDRNKDRGGPTHNEKA